MPHKNYKMKRIILLLLSLIFSISGIQAHNYLSTEISPLTESVSDDYNTVYVCTGNFAYAYHSRSNCPGLGNCKGSIKYTDENYAINKLKRVPCCRCWSNVSGRCKDDNPGTGGGGSGGSDPDAEAALAMVIIVFSAAILSNDIYAYPTVSFQKQYPEYPNYEIKSGFGWLFGFRKTLAKSAFEYGASYIKHDAILNNGYYSTPEELTRWGFHLNYVHELFYNKTPIWLKSYIGPSINYVDNFGYGGIVGMQFKLVNRLDFDVRYELTTTTNQIQFGLIFNYQKVYFWNK